MAELSKERIEQFIKSPLDNGLTRGEQMEMARQLLASMEREPVYQVLGDGSWTDYSKEQLDGLLESKPSTLFRVAYAAPQLPQPAVPDAISTRQAISKMEECEPCDSINVAFKYGWNACRTAMLQGAEPVSQPYTLRDGVAAIRGLGGIDAGKIQAERDALNEPTCWCHTCRPVTVDDMRFVVCPECGNKRCPHANDHRNACTGSNEPGQQGSAYPAAPQQEVKSALEMGMTRYGDAKQKLADGGD